MKKEAKNLITAFLAFWAIVLAVLYTVAANNSPQTVLYYGDTCPHCKLVEQYIQDNNIQAAMPIVMKEVFNDENNQKAIEATAKKCGLDSQTIVVPLFYYKGRCYVGDTDIIQLLNSTVMSK